MYRLLIVDDEPYIVTGLKALFEEASHLDLNILSATSASEALEWLAKTRIDIVLSDIRMPGISGLELLKRIRKQWPACKVIFLSGHNEFAYVQEAIQHGSAGYLLKTDDEEDILNAVARVIDELTSEHSMQGYIEQAKEQLKKALPILQKEYFMGMIDEAPTSEKTRRKNFEEMNIGLDASEPIMLVIGRVDRWQSEFTIMDKDLLLYAVQNIAHEILNRYTNMVSIVRDSNSFLWIIQLTNRNEGAESLDPVHFVQDSLDFIQNQTLSLLKVPISLSSTIAPFPWSDFSVKYRSLNKLLIRGLGKGEEMLLFESTENDEDATRRKEETLLHQRQTTLNQLKTLLESGHQDDFLTLLDRVFEQTSIESYEELQETYYAIATMILTQINRWSVYEDIVLKVPMDRSFALESHGSWQEAGNYLRQVSKSLFELLDQEKSDKGNEVIEKLHAYIRQNIADDVSLVRLADVAGLNSSYLCRLYKQLTGIGLSDYIADVKLMRAKKLLRESDLKIGEVAKHIGFDAGYFSRFFKKMTTLTPQEYRDGVTN